MNDVAVQLVTTYPSPPAPPLPPGTWTHLLRDVWPGASGWTGSITLDTSVVSTCGSLGTMLGGYQQLGANDYVEKVVDSLPAHTGLRITARFFKVDKWSNNRGIMLVDGGTAWQSPPYSSHGSHECGASTYHQHELAVDIDVTVAHTANSVTIRFTTDITGATQWWGINDVTANLVAVER